MNEIETDMNTEKEVTVETEEAMVNIEQKILEKYDFQIAKKDSIKARLQKNFLAISISIILLMSIFSLGYFYMSTKQEAVNLVRNKIQLAEVFMEAKKQETAVVSQNLANDRAIQIGLDLESPPKISEYLLSQTEQIKHYYISIFDSKGNLISDIGKNDSELFNGRKQISPSELSLMQEALKGAIIIDTITLVNGINEPYPAFIAVTPILRNNEVTGIVMVRFVFMDNFNFFSQMSKNIETEVAVYVGAKPIVKTSDMDITLEQYNEVSVMKRNTERISLTGAGLNEYRGIFSTNGDAVAVLHIYLSSVPYLKVFGMALIIYILMTIVVIILVSFAVLKFSNTIINPIEELLKGVNIIRGGDLAHEIILTVKDEIGRLSIAFNEMRGQLNEKITTIEDMNRSLEKTVEERTHTIETLNEKMKHYLSPQLYASIVGGERDASMDKHYRKKLSIFFSDIVNFTSTTESMEAEDLSALLNTYLDNMAQIAQKYGGTIDKYVGDAIMVFFGDPEFTSDKDHALRAVKMGMDMLDRLAELRVEWANAGINRPFHARMGINTGYCTIGNFGSETKMDYTIIGANVNLAARYESAAKPDTILISHETYMLVNDEIECVDAGRFPMKGIAEPVLAYNPVRLKNAPANPDVIKMSENHELIFPNKIVDTKNMTPEQRKSLLINIKEIFTTIKNNAKN